jgi:phospholipid/cholesterol/gamma-HCH transport system substrate-binding protein
MMAASSHGERGIRDQIARYRTAFISVVAMIVLAVLVGGYILSQERLSLPGWVPVLGKSYFTLKGDFETGQALTPGQGQAVTIAGAKVGEIARVEQHEGNALVTMNLTPKYAHYIYRNATMLLRPKTQLNDMTVEVDPGTPSAGRISNGYALPLDQTAPNVNVDEFLSALDGETRAYLQELLAGVAEGLRATPTTCRRRSSASTRSPVTCARSPASFSYAAATSNMRFTTSSSSSTRLAVRTPNCPS